MSRSGCAFLIFALAACVPPSVRAQSDLPRPAPNERPTDLFPPARPGVEDRPPAPRGPVNPLAGLRSTGLGGLANGGPGYGVDWHPSQSVTGQGVGLGVVRQDLSLAAPLWVEGGDALVATGHLKNMHVYTDARLPDTGRRFPKDLWNASVGLGYLHTFDNGWLGGLLVNFGSASDRPFHSIREVNVSVGGLIRAPACIEGDFWLFTLFYSPGGLLNFPIPGVAYQWNYSDRFRMTIGIPFSVMWKPTPDLTFNASYVPLTNVRAILDYRLRRDVHLYGGYESLNDAYFLTDRAERHDRFLSFEQRLIGGAKFDAFERATFDLHAGYSFGRRFGEGRNQGAALHDRIDVAPGAFLGAALRIKF